MKNVTLLALLIFHIQILSAQTKLKRKVDYLGNLKEVYFVDKKTKIREGKSFILDVNTKDTISLGDYKNGSRTGIWKFLDRQTGKEYMKFDYSNMSLLSLSNELIADSFYVKTDRGFYLSEVDRPLLYTGFNDELKIRLASQIKIPAHVIANEQGGVTLLNFKVDSLGNLTGARVVNSFNKEVDQNINQIINRLPGRFLPAILHGVPVESSFFIKVNVGLANPQSLTTPSFITEINIDFVTRQKVKKKRIGTTTRVLTADEMDAAKVRGKF